MNFRDLAGKLAYHHREHPQRAKMAEMALAQVHEGLRHLQSLGHNFEVVEAAPQPTLEYPKWVYHADQDPRVVESSFELEELGPGWYDHPERAKEMAGHDYQFAARGGVSRGSAPLVPLQEQGEPVSSALAKKLAGEPEPAGLSVDSPDEALHARMTQEKIEEMAETLKVKP